MTLSVLAVPLTPAVPSSSASSSSGSSTSSSRFPPTARSDSRGGVGVMIDDLIAGLYALALLARRRGALGWP